MFGKNQGDAPGMNEEQVFQHVMETLYGLGTPGAMITPGLVAGARDLAKGQRIETLRNTGMATSKVVKKTEGAYDFVGNKIGRMFQGPYAGATFPIEGGQEGDPSAPPPASAPCPALDNLAPHVATGVLSSSERRCYWCGSAVTAD